MSDATSNPSADMFEMFQKMVNPMAFPLQGLLCAGLDPKELEKKINELITVKHWLNANVGMIDLTIKTLEYQKTLMSSVSDVTKMTEPQGHTAGAEANPMMNPALWPWAMMKMTGMQPTDPTAGNSSGSDKKS
ncbi:hypothetical protein LHV13_05200 [Ferrovum sp. PN-J185]|uniref:PhaM family polyhydroxyalkanoate granule multifunctional regulatory protein n=1 Tax=Ferrovum sp. PN-J185 TaxID=1356306 RepID=UPI0007939273|nr:PhaM family polyhydroxyalkanoate granule multifunctional regulatory protein [Ferrovum sp. PN-J185]KXW55730.1 hypothetical protein FV185_14990 [Ferrovum sp. PN-J185]MCC6068572.1 hypothetical protein [Ferrovum sp. PN-J185]MDE1892115.1 hypothetical protein [Betaproteobacteria bacterium]